MKRIPNQRDFDVELFNAKGSITCNTSNDEIETIFGELKDIAHDIGYDWSIDWDDVYNQLLLEREANVSEMEDHYDNIE